ncbi:MAG TPA: mannosyltransferase family protein [Pirellulales bacterium]|nr:mannosyltransferase family protein [Pirellulales bacterium]
MVNTGNLPDNGAGSRRPIVSRRRRARELIELCADTAAFWYLSGLIFALGISFGYTFLAAGADARPTRRDVIEALGAFDAEWYSSIATRGYSYDVNARSNVAFFPLYPLLARAVAALLPIRIETALLIVSNASFLAALMVLASYARVRYPAAPEDLAHYVVLAVALFPTACFFRMPYSESTFLLLCVVSLYGIERRWSMMVLVVVVGLATAARPVGVALLAPLALDIWRRQPSFGRRLSSLGVWLPLACWGLAAYMAYQYAAFGDALAFAKTQEHWGVRAAPGLSGRLWACLTFEPMVAVYDAHSPAFWARRDAHGAFCFSLHFANPLFLFAAVALLLAGAAPGTRLGRVSRETSPAAGHGGGCVPSAHQRRGRTSDPPMRGRWLNRLEASLAVLLLLIPYLTRGYEMGMSSMGRFAAVVFPIYLVLGQLLYRLTPGAAAALLAASGFLMGCYSALFVAGRPIF